VEENVGLLRHYLYAERRFCLLLAGHLPSIPEMAIKQGIGRHLWEDAEHASWLIERIGQLRTSRTSLDAAPDGALATLVDELLWWANTAELIVGVYVVVKPALVAAYRWHISATNPLVDFPTARLLRFALAEEEAQLEWSASVLPELPASAELTAWRGHLERLLGACGSMTGADMFAKAGLPAPADHWKTGDWTWDTFPQTAQKMTIVDTNGRTTQFGYLADTVMWGLAPWILANGGDILSQDRTKSLLDQPKAVQVVSFQQDLMNKYQVAPNAADTKDVDLYFLEPLAQNYAKLLPLNPFWPDMENKADSALQAIFGQNQSVQQTFSQLTPQINQILAGAIG